MDTESRKPVSSAEAAATATILVVDDNDLNRELLVQRLEYAGHQVVQAVNGLEALNMLRSTPIDLVLLDIMMPVMDGHQALKEIKSDAQLCHTPVIIITAFDGTDDAVRCIEQGAEDYIAKPFNAVLLHSRVRASLNKKRLYDLQQIHRDAMTQHNLKLEAKVQQQFEQTSAARFAAVFALSRLAELKDRSIGEHLTRMPEYCRLLAPELARLPKYRSIITKTFEDNIYAASPLHDIGKVSIPDSVLLKSEPLSEGEWEVMKTHSRIGSEILRAIDHQYPGNALIRTGIDLAEYHHEKWDGSGYPHGLAGEQIPLVARILALADVYDTLTSARCYKENFSHEKSRAIIIGQAGTCFDPDVVQAFLNCEHEFERIRNQFHDPGEDQQAGVSHTADIRPHTF